MAITGIQLLIAVLSVLLELTVKLLTQMNPVPIVQMARQLLVKEVMNLMHVDPVRNCIFCHILKSEIWNHILKSE